MERFVLRMNCHELCIMTDMDQTYRNVRTFKDAVQILKSDLIFRITTPPPPSQFYSLLHESVWNQERTTFSSQWDFT